MCEGFKKDELSKSRARSGHPAEPACAGMDYHGNGKLEARGAIRYGIACRRRIESDARAKSHGPQRRSTFSELRVAQTADDELAFELTSHTTENTNWVDTLKAELAVQSGKLYADTNFYSLSDKTGNDTEWIAERILPRVSWPNNGQPSGGYVVPDGLFGIAYQDGDARPTYRFFALEADRGTMPIARSDRKQTSYLGKLAAYDEIIARQIHKTHWGIPNLLVLTVTTSAARASEIVGKLPDGRPAFLFKAIEGRALSAPALHLLLEPWMRPGSPPLCIAVAR